MEANWRTGPEGGLDEIHRYLHRDSKLLLNTQATMPLGHTSVHKNRCEIVEAADGPKGVIDQFDANIMYFEADIEDAKGVVKGIRFDSRRRAEATPRGIGLLLAARDFARAGISRPRSDVLRVVHADQ